MEALNNYTQTALHDVEESISLLNTEITLMRKAILQNRMALDVLTGVQGGTYAIIKTECCVYIPDSSGNVTDLLRRFTVTDRGHVLTGLIMGTDS